jgi:hypothetical protein
VRNSNVRHQGIVRFDEKNNNDVFHAELEYEKTCEELNVLKQAYQKEDWKDVEEIKGREKKDDLFSEEKIHVFEKAMRKRDVLLK